MELNLAFSWLSFSWEDPQSKDKISTMAAKVLNGNSTRHESVWTAALKLSRYHIWLVHLSLHHRNHTQCVQRQIHLKRTQQAAGKSIDINPLTNNQSYCNQQQSPEENLGFGMHHVLQLHEKLSLEYITHSIATSGHFSPARWFLKRFRRPKELSLKDTYVENLAK